MTAFFRHSILVLYLFLSACMQKPEMTLSRLLDNHAEARGGYETLQAIQTMDVKLEIVEPDFTVTGHYRASRDGVMRVDIFVGNTRVFTEALGRNGGWQMSGDGTVKDLSPEGAAKLQRGIISNLYSLNELPSLGYKLTLVGSTQRNGSEFWEVEKRHPDGFSENLFLDKDTFLITSSVKTSALHPDIDNAQVREETITLEHQTVAGVVYDGKSEKHNLDTGAIMQTTTVLSRVPNTSLDLTQFERPMASDD